MPTIDVASAREAKRPIIPFLVAQSGPYRKRRPLVARPSEGTTVAGRRLAAEQGSDVDCVVFAYDGFVTTSEGRSDAILVEAHERGMSRTLIFAQRYRRRTLLREFSTVGNPLLFAACEPFLPRKPGAPRTSLDVDFF